MRTTRIGSVTIRDESFPTPDEWGAMTLRAGYFLCTSPTGCVSFDWYATDETREIAERHALEWAELHQHGTRPRTRGYVAVHL